MTQRAVSFLSGAGLLLAACIWGFAFVVVKDSLDFVSPFYMMAFRFTIASFVLVAIYAKKLMRTPTHTWLEGIVLGVFIFLAYATQTVGCNYTTAGKNAFLTTVYVLLVPLFSWPLYKKRPAWYVFVAAVMSLIGIGFLALGNGDSLLSINKGDALTLACGFFYAVHIIYMKKCNDDGGDPILLTCLQLFFCAIFSWIFAAAFGGGFPSEAVKNPRVIISMLYLGLLSSLLCYVLQNVGLKFLASPIVSLLMSFESVFGVLFSTIFLHESFTLKMGIGCALIFLAVVLAETKFEFFGNFRAVFGSAKKK